MDSLTSGSEKKFYQKPENLVGLGFTLILAAIAYNYGPGLLSGILSFGGFLAVSAFIAIVGAVVFTQWRLIGTLFHVAMYKLTNAVYAIDPISIAWAKLDKLKEKKIKINEAVEKIGGALDNVVKEIKTNQDQFNRNASGMETMSKKGDKTSVELIARKNVRIQTTIEQLTPLQTVMANMKAGLKKIYEAADFVIQDKEDELTSLEKRYNSVKIGWAAVREAQGIYGTNSADRKDIEQLIGMADTDMTNKLAEMDRFMELAKPVFDDVDIEKGLNDSRVQEMIQQITGVSIDKMVDNIISPNTVQTKTITQGTVKQQVPTKQAQPVKVLKSSSGSSNGSEKPHYSLDDDN